MVIPHSPEAEKAILGIALSGSTDAYESICASLPTDGLFHDERHREVWNRIERLADQRKPINIASVMGLRIEHEIEPAYLAELESNGLPESCLPSFLPEALAFRQKRAALDVAVELGRGAQSAAKISEVIEAAETKLFAARFQAEQTQTLRDIINAAIDDWEKASQNPNEKTGIESGFADLDEMTWGFQPANLVVIGARPSQGKTALLCNICEHVVIKNKIPSLFFSLEMTRKEIVKRMICSQARQSSSVMRAGRQSDLTPVTVATGHLSSSPLWIEDRGQMTIAQMRSLSRRHVSRNGVKIIFVDYLQKVKPTKSNEKRTYEVGQVSEGLKEIAKECNVPVVAACQLNRESEKDQKPRPPRPSDLGDSGMIERDADVIACLYRRPKEEQTEGATLLYSLLVQKHRDGPTGNIRLVFFKEFTQFQTATNYNHHEI